MQDERVQMKHPEHGICQAGPWQIEAMEALGWSVVVAGAQASHVTTEEDAGELETQELTPVLELRDVVDDRCLEELALRGIATCEAFAAASDEDLAGIKFLTAGRIKKARKVIEEAQ